MLKDWRKITMTTEKDKIIEKMNNEISNGITISDDCYNYLYKKLFNPFWKREWDKLEGEINHFSFKFFKEGYQEGVKNSIQSQKQDEIKFLESLFNDLSDKENPSVRRLNLLFGKTIKERLNKLKEIK